MIRKKSSLGSFDGLTLEMTLLLPFALGYLLITHQDIGNFGKDTSISLLLMVTGLATAAPLLFFAYGAKSISLSLLGILQFIGPTGQLIIGWLLYQEPMPSIRLVSFAFIWLAVIIYTFSLRKQLPET